MFHYIELDLYTNLNDTLHLLCGALWPKRQTRKPYAATSIAEFADKAYLTKEEAEELQGTVAGIVDFWLTLKQTIDFSPVPAGKTAVYRCARPETRGDTALKQTIRWLNKKSIQNPVVWNEA